MSKVAFPVLIAGILFSTLADPARAADDADPAKLEASVEKLLDAYNKNDVKAFFTNWAGSVKAITTESMYNALFKDGAKKTHGDYKAKTLKLKKEGSVLSGDYLIVYFDAEFVKEKSGVVAVNFAKEGGDYKFMQVQIQKKK